MGLGGRWLRSISGGGLFGGRFISISISCLVYCRGWLAAGAGGQLPRVICRARRNRRRLFVRLESSSITPRGASLPADQGTSGCLQRTFRLRTLK